jgi:hypothetical protein
MDAISFGVVILKVRSNRLRDILVVLPRLEAAIATVAIGTTMLVR